MSKGKNKKKKTIIKKVTRKTTSSNKYPGKLMMGLICALFGFLLYANTLTHQYALDDASVITDNFITKKGLEGIPLHLQNSYRFGYWNSKGTLYRPVSLLMFATEWQISPDNPFLYHLINVLLYAFTGFLLFYTLSRILSGTNLLFSFLVTLFFLAHPVHVEVVANIKSRDEILAFLFCIATLYFLWDYVQSGKLKGLILALLAFSLAMFSKENSITFLAIFPLVLFFFSKKTIAEIAKISVLMLIPALLYLGVRYRIIEGATIASISPLDNLLMAAPDVVSKKATAFLLIGKYFLTLIFPHPLGSDFGYNQIPIVSFGNWKVLLSLIAFIGIIVFALIQLPKKKMIAFGILYFMITFSIFSNLIIDIGSSFGDRFLYMPSLGFAIVLTALIFKFSKLQWKPEPFKLNGLIKKYGIVLAIPAVIILLYSIKTISRNKAWYDSYTLYAADIHTAPNCAKLNYHLGLEQNKKGLAETNPQLKTEWMDKAMDRFRKALEIYPSYGDAYSQLGLAYFRKNDFNNALTNYAKALEYKPNDAQTYSNMGIIYFNQGNLAKAREVYEKAVQLHPRFVDARRNLGSVYAQTKQFDKAIEQFNEALKYAPDNATLYLYLGYVYRDKGDTATAQNYFNKAYQLDPSLRK